MVSISGDARTSMTVTWRTSIDISGGFAEYRKDGSNQTKRVQAVSEVFESDIDISRINWAEITGLEPAQSITTPAGMRASGAMSFILKPSPKT
jgi:hypothetical protein